MKKKIQTISNEVYFEDGYYFKTTLKNQFKIQFALNNEVQINHLYGNDFEELPNGKLKSLKIKGTHPTSELLTKENLELIAKELKRFHNLINNWQNFKIAPFLQTYQELFQSLPSWEREQEVIAEAEKLFTKQPQVLLHNDLIDGNILINGEIVKLIDFEYSGVGYYGFDIAAFLTEREINLNQTIIFLKQFPIIEEKELMILKLFMICFWGKWALNSWLTTKEVKFKTIYDLKVKQYENELKK